MGDTCISGNKDAHLNRLFPGYPLPLFQNESPCETIHMKMSFTCTAIFIQISHFHLNGWREDSF